LITKNVHYKNIGSTWKLDRRFRTLNIYLNKHCWINYILLLNKKNDCLPVQSWKVFFIIHLRHRHFDFDLFSFLFLKLFLNKYLHFNNWKSVVLNPKTRKLYIYTYIYIFFLFSDLFISPFKLITIKNPYSFAISNFNICAVATLETVETCFWTVIKFTVI
jgi:hypothetical protein